MSQACLEDIDSSNKDDYGYRSYIVYDVDTVFDSAKGSVSLDMEYYRAGDTATATVTRKVGYPLDALSDEQKAKVTNAETLENAEKELEDIEAAEEVIALIDEIGEVGYDSKYAINAAREAYEALPTIRRRRFPY